MGLWVKWDGVDDASDDGPLVLILTQYTLFSIHDKISHWESD